MTRRAPLPAARGFTLVELIIAIGATTVLVAAAMTLLMSQQRAFQAGSADRALQEGGRVALAELVDRLRGAGYGMDPGYVLDFGENAEVPQRGLAAPATLGAQASYACASPVRCRDRTDAPDEVVFHARDPLFSRPVTGATTSTLTIRGQLREPLRPGQILQVMCLTGPRLRAYVTVGSTVPAVPNPNPAASVTIQLRPGVQLSGRDAFPRQNAQLADACFGGNAVVAKIDRYRYYVASYLEDGTLVANQTPGSRPYLMRDQGLLDDAGAPILVPVAADVEDLQLAWFYPPATATGAPRLLGDTSGTNAADEAFPMAVVRTPAIDDPPTAASRATGSPANVLGARVSVVVRSPTPDIAFASALDRTIPPPVTDPAGPLANRPAYLGVPNHRRMRFDMTVRLPNLANQTVLYCIIGNDPGMNLGGC